MKTPTGLTIVHRGKRIEVYDPEEFKGFMIVRHNGYNKAYKRNVWWSKVKELFGL